MEKIDKRKKYYIVIDTETCPIDRQIEEVTPKNMLVYDMGFCVVDKRGVVYKTGSYIVSNIFFSEFYTKMQSCYYKDKIPLYFDQIGKSERIVKSWGQISWIIRKVIEEYNITSIVAHNAMFDFGSLKNTKEYLEEFSMFPYMEWLDTLKMAKSVIAEMPTYQRYCKKNDYLTPTGKCKLTAEILYKFISKNDDFKENHTGLEDTLIEKEILAYCIKQHKKMDKKLFN